MDFIPQMEPGFDAAEADAVRDYILAGGWLTEFRQTQAFEAAIGDFTGARHCVATPNGTSALTLALLTIGVGPGDEVVVPDFTAIATANAASILGASPVFVDIEADTLNIDIALVDAAITRRTKAVVHVSLNGRSNDIPALKSLCRARGVHLIEDAAQSLGSFRDGRHLGTIGELGCLSFSSPKVITTGQGGAVLTDDDDLAAAMRRRKNFGRAADGREIHDMAGFNFKFTDLQAVVGLEQMKKLAGRLRRKKEIWARYAAGLAGVADVTLLATDLDQVAPWFIDIYVDNRDELGDGLKDAGIGTRTVYPPIHAQRAYGRRDNSYPVAAAASARGLWLPSSFQLTDDQVDRVCGAIRAFYGA